MTAFWKPILLENPAYTKISKKTCLNGYMFWTQTDCYSMTPTQAQEKFPEKLWWVEAGMTTTAFTNWVQSMVLKQDKEGLDAMRTEYTEVTGLCWLTAKLYDVYRTLGDCKELWMAGKVLIKGEPNLGALKKSEIAEIMRLVDQNMATEK